MMTDLNKSAKGSKANHVKKKQSTYIDATNEHKSTKRKLRINQLQIKGWGQTMNYEDNHKY